MSMRIVVNAHLSIGDFVNVPVGVSPATNQSADISFKTLHALCETPIKQGKFCPSCGTEHLNPEDLVKGFEVSKGQYVVVTEQELAAIKPDRDPVITVTSFLGKGMTEAVESLTDGAHWLVPNAAFEQPYAVIARAMNMCRAIAVGHHVLWGKETLCAVTVTHQHELKLHKLVLPSDVVVPDFTLGVASKDAVALASRLIETMTGTDAIRALQQASPTVRDSIKALVQAKAQGMTLEIEPAPELVTTVDLMESLRQAVAAREEVKPSKKAKVRS